MLKRSAFAGAVGRYLRDERGAVVVDHLPVLFLTLILVLLVFEIGVAYFLNLGTAKAAQLGARVAVTLPALHPDVPALNTPHPGDVENGVWCHQPDGADVCTDPGGPWVCDGASLDACDGATFARIVADMRRSYPRLAPEDVVITYTYRRLGVVRGDFVPEVMVTVRSQSYTFLTLIMSDVVGAFTEKGPILFAGASSSAFGEHMRGGI